MNLKAKAVTRIAESLFPDVKSILWQTKKDYIESKEFHNLVQKELNHVEQLSDLANAMGELAQDSGMVIGSNIHLDGYTFYYNVDNDCFEYTSENDIVSSIKDRVEYDLGLSYLGNKERYLQKRILGIISTFDESTTFDNAKVAVINALDFKAILFDKTI